MEVLPNESTLNLLDIDENMLLDILKELSVPDLVAVACTCKYMRWLARRVFRSRSRQPICYNSSQTIVQICQNCRLSDDGMLFQHTAAPATTPPIIIDQVIVVGALIWAFGDLVRDLDLRLVSNMQTTKLLLNAVTQRCGHSTEKLCLAGDGNLLAERKLAFTNQMPFNQLVELKLIDIDCDFDTMTFPQLTTIIVHSRCDDALTRGAFNRFIKRHPQLHEVHIDAAFVAARSALASLEHLDTIFINGWTAECMSLRLIQHLRELNIVATGDDNDGICQFLFCLRARRMLTTLRISQFDEPRNVAQFRRAISAMTQLRTLWICSKGFSIVDNLGDSWNDLLLLVNLQELTIINTKTAIFDALANFIICMPSLRRISIYMQRLELEAGDCHALRELCEERNVRLAFTIISSGAYGLCFRRLYPDFFVAQNDLAASDISVFKFIIH